MNTNQLKNNRFKEARPEDTIKKIQDILVSIGIETEELWFPESVIGTFSLRVNLKGTLIGSNGKGMTREFAKASAYAEFIERFQNNKLVSNAILATVMRRREKAPYFCKNEKFFSAEELTKENNAFIRYFCKRRGVDFEDKSAVIKFLQKYQKMDYNILKQKNQFLCIPFYSMKEGKEVYIPFFMANLHYGSNGMCAGNTKAEAIVQGLSEIIERMIQTEIVMECISLPNIPESYLEKYDYIYKMYSEVKKFCDGYTILIKDCSMGGKYSAAALVLIEKDTGKFGVKVGCHPDYCVALERLFTEATQGISLQCFAKKTEIDFYNEGVSTEINRMNGYKTADAKFPYQLLSDESDYKFCEPCSVEGKTNEQLLESMEKIFLDQGIDILIRDVSFLGFPSYQIIIPGYSELNNPNDMYFEAENTRFHVQPLIQNPELIQRRDCKYVISVVNYFKYNLLENSMKVLSGCFLGTGFPCAEIGMDQYYFLAMCHAYMGQFDKAAEFIEFVNQILARDAIKEKLVEYRSVEHYFKAMHIMGNHEKVMGYLQKMFRDEICKWIDDMFGNSDKILVKQFASVDLSSINPGEILQPDNKLFEFTSFESLYEKYINA